MKINIEEKDAMMLEYPIIPIGVISEDFDVYPSLWYFIFECKKKQYVMAFTETDVDTFCVVYLGENHYGCFVKNHTLDVNQDYEYAFYLMPRQEMDILKFFHIFKNPDFASLFVEKDTFVEQTGFVDVSEEWENLIDKLKDSKYSPKEILDKLEL